MNLAYLNILFLLITMPICWYAARWISRYPFTRKIWFRTLALALVVLGLLMETDSSQKINDSFKRRSWAQTTGLVVRSSVIGKRAYRPNIVYQFELNSKVHVDSTDLNPASFGGRNARQKSAEKISATYHPGDSVMVWINPDNPSETRLSIHVFWAEYLKICFGFSLYLTGLALFLGGLRSFDKSNN